MRRYTDVLELLLRLRQACCSARIISPERIQAARMHIIPLSLSLPLFLSLSLSLGVCMCERIQAARKL